MRQKMERVGAVCPELLRYRQNSWDNSCRKDLENPGNSGKAKTQERKNKKRPAAPDSAIHLDIDFNKGLLTEGKSYWNKVCTAATIFNLTGHYPMMGSDAIARFLEKFPESAKLSPAGGQFATDQQSAVTYGITELNGKKDGYFRFWQATDKGWKIVLQVITFGK